MGLLPRVATSPVHENLTSFQSDVDRDVGKAWPLMMGKSSTLSPLKRESACRTSSSSGLPLFVVLAPRPASANFKAARL